MSTALKRPRYPMPEFVRAALIEKSLMAAYLNRPAYQQNDYIGWISRAKRNETTESDWPKCLKNSPAATGT